MKKPIKLVPNRICGPESKKWLRNVIKDINSGRVVSVNIATIVREGDIERFSEGGCAVRAVGACELLKEHIMSSRLNLKEVIEF